MHTITFTCETITPMFLSGADGTTPELRAPSIKGALRFWWRAMNGHLGLGDLKKVEGEIFGDTDKRSSFAMQVIEPQALEKLSQVVLPHKERSFSKWAFKPRQLFQVVFRCRNEKTKQLIENLFPLCCILGGFGGRSRRGFGSISLKNSNYPNTLTAIKNLLDNIVPNKFTLQSNELIYLTTLKNQYPYIESITIGRADAQMLRKIGQVTHEQKQQYGRRYDAIVGSASPRFASPVYVSTIQTPQGVQSIITTLHHASKDAIHVPSTNEISRVQGNFKQQIIQ